MFNSELLAWAIQISIQQCHSKKINCKRKKKTANLTSYVNFHLDTKELYASDLFLRLQIPSIFRQGSPPHTHPQKTPAHEEIKSISLHGIEFQSGTAVAGYKIWRIRLFAHRMIFPSMSDRSQGTDIFPFIITEVPWNEKSGPLCLIASIERKRCHCWKGVHIPPWQPSHTQWKLPFWSTATSKHPDQTLYNLDQWGQCT